MSLAAARVLTAQRVLQTHAAVRLTPGAYISVANNSYMNTPGSLTALAWVRPRGNAYTVGNVLTYGTLGLGTTGWDVQTSYTGQSGVVSPNAISVAFGQGTDPSFAANTGGLSFALYGDGKWHHVGIQWDGSNLNPCVDGKLLWPQALTTAWAATTHPFYIGGDYTGDIADVVVYNGTALSASQIAAIAAGSEPPAAGLTARWRLNEGSGTVAHDSGPYGLAGTLYKGAAWSMPAPAS